ncbi:hypothetical protein D3C81_654300 [compost metagenome]
MLSPIATAPATDHTNMSSSAEMPILLPVNVARLLTPASVWLSRSSADTVPLTPMLPPCPDCSASRTMVSLLTASIAMEPAPASILTPSLTMAAAVFS